MLFQFEKHADFVDDREDLIFLLRLRFGEVEPEVIEAIYEMDDLETIDRLILVAANAPEFRVFLEELNEGRGSFRIMGERFNPITTMLEGSGGLDEEKK